MEHLRCYAIRKGDSWYASCLDLNLVDRADSLDEVIQKLRENIQLYVEDKNPLLQRPAPISYHFEYQWILLKTWLLNWVKRPPYREVVFTEVWDGRQLKAVGA